MLNIENYVSWSSRLFCYAKSRPKGKLIYNSIMNGPYVRRMIPEPSDVDHEVPVSETFHEQADDELTEKELKHVKANDQAIQTILLGLPKDIYAAVDGCETAQEIWQIAQLGMNLGQDNHMQMVRGNRGISLDNMLGRMSGIRNDNVVAAQTEGNANGNNDNLIRCYNCRGLADLDEIEEVNSDCILMANLQQASTSGTQTDKAPVYDSDGSAESANFEIQFLKEAAKFVRDFKSLAKEANESLAKNKAFELEIECLLRAVVPQKVNKTNDLSNPVTSNSVPTTKVSKVVKHDKVIAPGMFRINPFKNSRKERFMPNRPIKASVRTNPITVSQPRVITKKVINFDSKWFPFAFKSSHIKNKEVKVKEHPRNLLLSKNKKHMSSECNNVKLSIRNDKSEIICAMCKQCLITTNHDVCVLNYVNGMNSCGKKQKENVSNIANQTKHMPQVKKPKKVWFIERVASPKPSKPKMCLRWSPTGRIFDLCGKLIGSSDSECKSDTSVYNECTSNPQEPAIKWFPNSTSSLGRALCYPKNNREDIGKLGEKDTAPTPTNSSSQATNFPNTSHDVNELEAQQQHVQHQPTKIIDNVLNAMFDENMFVNPFATPSISAAESSSSQYVDPSNMHTFNQPYPHEY
uniref:Uncharacterized protein n=1 Tax=Tanacetum cinerariifolium TaxID=118510 RepID=A0A6L2LPK8_TANCI|nr:hypothetical protein [Tanacetum cinerariifolium]